MRLLLLHPRVAARSCSDCQTYQYDDRGEKFGDRVTRAGLPVLRPKGTRPPCRFCPKVPPGMPADPASAVELDAQFSAAYAHYRECQAVGAFPDDPVVRRHAAVFRAAEDAIAREAGRQDSLTALGRLLGDLRG